MDPDAGRAGAIPAPRHLHDDLTFLLVKLGRLAAARFATALAEEGLRPPHYGALIALEELGAVPQSAIADALHTDRSHVVGLLDDLEQRGYVTRTPDPDD